MQLVTVSVVLATLGAVGAVELQGHRGARGLWPENTLEGFKRTLALGVDVLELDVLLSADDVVVLHHNPRVNADIARDGSGQWISEPTPLVRSLSYGELRGYDVGMLRPRTRYASRYPRQVSIDGARIPRLKDVLTLAGSQPVGFNIELKRNPELQDLYPEIEHFVRQVIKTIDAAGVSGPVTIQSFDWHVLEAVKGIAPHIPLVCLTVERRWLDNIRRGQPGASPWTAGLDIEAFDGSVPRMVHAFGAEIWSPHWRDLDDASLKDARRLGLRVIVWTVNERDAMRKLLERGVDGIITDYPDRLREVMAERGMALPRSVP